MKKFSFYDLINKGDAGLYWNVNKIILVEKYNLEDREAFLKSQIKDNGFIAKQIGTLYSRSTETSRIMTAFEVEVYENRMFESAGISAKYIGTREFQENLLNAYQEQKIKDIEHNIESNNKRIAFAKNENESLKKQFHEIELQRLGENSREM